MTNRTDDFNRADSTTTMGSPSDGGTAWSVQSGTWGIISNTGYKVATDFSNEVTFLEASATSGETFIKISGSTPLGGPLIRGSNNDNYILGQLNGSTLTLWKKVATNFTNLGSGAVTHVAGDTYSIKATSANDLTVYKNAVQIATANDSALSTATKVGIYGSTIGSRYEDFSFVDAAGAAGGGFVDADPLPIQRPIDNRLEVSVWS